MIEELIKINDELILKCVNNDTLLKRHKLIKGLLLEKNCFLKMDINTAFSILSDLRIPKDQIENVYKKLIDASFYEE